MTPLNCFYTVTLQATLPNSLSPHFIFSKHSNPKLLKYFSCGGTCIFWIIQQLLKSNHGDRPHMVCWAIMSCFLHPFSLFPFLDIFFWKLCPTFYFRELYLVILRSFKSITSQESKAKWTEWCIYFSQTQFTNDIQISFISSIYKTFRWNKKIVILAKVHFNRIWPVVKHIVILSPVLFIYMYIYNIYSTYFH